MKFSSFLFLCPSLMAMNSIFSVAISADIYSKKDGAGNEHYIICYGDYHMYEDMATEKKFLDDCVKQKHYFLGTLAKNPTKSNIAVIVEDMRAPFDITINGDRYYQKNVQEPYNFLNIFLKLQTLAIPVYNIEYRWIFLLPTAPISHILFLQGTMFDEVKSYNDTPQLNTFYEECIDFSSRSKNPIIDDLIEHQSLTYQEYKDLKLGDEEKMDEYYEMLLDLIDARIMHKIHELQDKKVIIVCAGILHVENIESALEGMGYARIKSTHNDDDEVRILPISPEFFDEISVLTNA